MGIPIGSNLSQGVYHPENKSTSGGPKPPAPLSPAAALAEHIAIQNGGFAPTHEAGIGVPESTPNVGTFADYSGLQPAGAPVGLSPLQLFAWRQAKKRGVDPRIFLAQIAQESGFNPKAVSSAGAQGIAQFMPATAAGVGLDDPFKPRPALRAAAEMDAQNYAKYKNYKDVLSLYNSGRGWAQGQNIPETKNYVESILSHAPGVLSPQDLWRPGNLFAKGVTPSIIGTPYQGTHSPEHLNNWQSDSAIDFAAPEGTMVYAPVSGRLVGGFGQSNGGGGGTVYGNRLTLDPKRKGISEMFFTHLNQLAPGIEAGARIKRGQPIGTIGGLNGIPSHLHWAYQPSQEEFNQRDPSVAEGFAASMYPGLFKGTDPSYGYYSEGGGAGGGSGSPYQSSTNATASARTQAAQDLMSASLSSYEVTPGRGRRRRKSPVDDLIANLANIQAGGSYLGA